jgi:hypothetical protein
MKSILSYIIVFTVIVSGLCSCRHTKHARAVAVSSVREIRLTSFINQKNHTLGDNKMEAYLIVDTSQHPSRGISFSIRLQNDSGANITAPNLLGLLDIHLYNEHGEDVLPFSIPSGLRDGRKGTGTHSFEAVDALVNGRSLGIDLWSQTSMTIPGNGTYEIMLKIDKGLKPGSLNSNSTDRMQEIAKGVYRLSVMLPLPIGGDFKKHEIVVADRIQIDYN